MSSHALTLYLQKRMPGGKYRLVNDDPVFRDASGAMEILYGNFFDYLKDLDELDKKEIPAPIKKRLNVDGYNFYTIECADLYTDLCQVLDTYANTLKGLCKALGFTDTKATTREHLSLGPIKGDTTLPVNQELVGEVIDSRNKAMTASYMQGMLQAWVNGAVMITFRLIAVYDY
jgi:hypothetical protein